MKKVTKTKSRPWVNLFNEAEAKPVAPEPTIEEITYKRRKKRGHREEMLQDLPVEVIAYLKANRPVIAVVDPCMK